MSNGTQSQSNRVLIDHYIESFSLFSTKAFTVISFVVLLYCAVTVTLIFGTVLAWAAVIASDKI